MTRWDPDDMTNTVYDTVSDVVIDRQRNAGFLLDSDLFDNAFFSVSPAEAAVMEPAQRLALEKSYEALHGTGYSKADLMGSLTGVWVGMWASEYTEVLRQSKGASTVYAATASTCSVACGRISFALGLQGPCSAIDTACSSGIVAAHDALRAVQNTECKTGLVVGINMIFSQWTSMMMATAGMTSPKGRCHTFDARADGYARGEGIYAISLQASGDTTKPVMHGCAIQQDGKSASLTAPNGQAQIQLMRAGMADAGTPPSDLACYEAHGTGTPLGDPIEVRSTKAAILAGRGDAEPLQIGSVKANCGHGEPAAGVLGIIRLAMGLMAGQAPPNAQLRAMNEHVASTMEGSTAGAMPVQIADLPRCRTRCPTARAE